MNEMRAEQRKEKGRRERRIKREGRDKQVRKENKMGKIIMVKWITHRRAHYKLM